MKQKRKGQSRPSINAYRVRGSRIRKKINQVSTNESTVTAPTEFKDVLISFGHTDSKGNQLLGSTTLFQTEKSNLTKSDLAWLEEELAIQLRLANLKILSFTILDN